MLEGFSVKKTRLYSLHIIMLIIFMCISITIGVKAQTDELAETYETEESRLSFSYPSGWTVVSSDLIAVLNQTDSDIEVIIDATAYDLVDATMETSLEVAQEMGWDELDVSVEGGYAFQPAESLYILLVDVEDTLIGVTILSPSSDVEGVIDLVLTILDTLTILESPGGILTTLDSATLDIISLIEGEGILQQEVNLESDLGYLGGIAVGDDGKIYIADSFNGILRISPDQPVIEIMSNTRLAYATDVTFINDTLYIIDDINNELVAMDQDANVEVLLELDPLGFTPEQITGSATDGVILLLRDGDDRSVIANFTTEAGLQVLASSDYFAGIAVDSNGAIFTYDPLVGIIRISSDRSEILLAESNLPVVEFIEFLPDGTLLIAGFSEVLVITLEGEVVHEYTIPAMDEDSLFTLRGIAPTDTTTFAIAITDFTTSQIFLVDLVE